MNNIKNTFTIKDLENLSGIKAHTIRIWEKRYGVLEPMRTNTNIRVYDTRNLQKLLNINTLNTFGYKISHIAKLPEERILEMVREILTAKTLTDHVLRDFKLSMMNFNTKLFIDTYNNLLAAKPFRDIFYECFIPLLEEIGNLWQTDTISPAHEHFISNLVKQKIMINIEALQAAETKDASRTYVLYLPEGEIHEIGLMLLNYELLHHGYQTIYLGESVPIDNIIRIKKMFDNLTFVTYITVESSTGDTNSYVEQMKNEVVNDESTELLICGKCSDFVQKKLLDDKVKVFRTPLELANQLPF